MLLLSLTISVLGISSPVCCQGSVVTSNLLAEVIDECFVFRQVPLLIICDEEDSVHFDLVDQIIGNLRYSRAVQLDPTNSEYKTWFYSMFLFVSYEDFATFIYLMDWDQYDLYGYYLFILNEATNLQVLNAFDIIWQLKLLRVLIIVFNGDQPELFNYSPYTAHTCGKPMVHRFDPYNSSQLFVARLEDFSGCQIILGTFETPPFIHFQEDNSINGFEGDLVNTLAEKLNFRLVIVTPPDDAQWGDPRPNGSTGLMKLLQDETVHFGIGCLGIMTQRNEILQPGRPHYNSRVLFAVPEGRPLNSFEKLFQPFDRTVWMTEGMLIGITISVVLMLKFAPDSVRDFIYGANNRTPFLNAINIFYTGGLCRTPKRNFARTLLILWVLHCFVMRTVYQGLLFKYLQVASNHRPIDTIDNIERSALFYHINKNAERFFTHNPSLFKRIRYITPGNDSVSVALDDVSSRRVRDEVVVCTLEHIAYHNKRRLQQGFLRSSRDSISSYPMAIYYPKRTFLVRILDRMIGRIETAGLVNFWVRRYGNYNFFPRKIDHTQPTAIRIEQLLGCFECICVQWMISFGVFVLELLSLRFPCIRRILEFLTNR
ncbi:uncharacterized protein LOC134207507 [Armigeres subalbatus]|uniref:uncharacterized protein LOC134207507 n=1 Tax=Armigeres subalbatus TaxID=124917 RepID=UPI002ED59242